MSRLLRIPTPLRPAGDQRVAVACLVLLAALAIILGCVQVERRQATVRIGYDISAADAELRRLARENHDLRVEMSLLSAPERIERLALDMGMVRLEPSRIRLAAPQQAQQGDDDAR